MQGNDGAKIRAWWRSPQERFLCGDDALLSGVVQAARAMAALPRKMDERLPDCRPERQSDSRTAQVHTERMVRRLRSSITSHRAGRGSDECAPHAVGCCMNVQNSPRISGGTFRGIKCLILTQARRTS